MIINRHVHKLNTFGQEIKSSNSLNKIGFWADVTSVDSKNNWCSITSDFGISYDAIPVISREWVTDKENFVASERDLPQIGSRVFVLVPDGNIASAFILCSGFPFRESKLQTLWAKNEDEVELKNKTKEKITRSGWNIKEYEIGNLELTSLDNNVNIHINIKQNDNLSQNKEIKLSAWNNNITITEDGLSIQDKNNNSIVMDSNSIKLNGNLEVLK